MKIVSLRISNILSFKNFDDIASAQPIIFDDGLNIIIGENGSGKSTALEVINFIFKRVLFKQFTTNQELYLKKSSIGTSVKRQIITPANAQSYNGFRLEPNWDSEDKHQKIRLEIKLDDIDKSNIQLLRDHINDLSTSVGVYTAQSIDAPPGDGDSYILDIELNITDMSFSVNIVGGSNDFGYQYLTNYNFYKELIEIYNLENPSNQIEPLYESFTLIGGYRNYNAFNTSISLREQSALQQIQQIRNLDFSKSLNSTEQSEPGIFGLVRLRVAEQHFKAMDQKLNATERENQANNLPFIKEINEKLKVINLECRIKLKDWRTWQYSFEFKDLGRNKNLPDINSLSAGQKSILHLIFEAYGRGDLMGGVVIIDEPEIHLHYQFQNEYLEVIKDLNNTQKSQYIIVTHSESLINSSTINYVKRFSRNQNGDTVIYAPTLSTSQKTLIKILDNTRSTYAFFARKALLVEGDSDRYFYRAVLHQLHPELDQEIAVLYINGSGSFNDWRNLFESFGLTVHSIGDSSVAIDLFFPLEKGVRARTSAEVAIIKSRNPDWENKITSEYTNNNYILKKGTLEEYLHISRKDLSEVINFCNNNLATYLKDIADDRSKEIRDLIKMVVI